MNVNRRTFIGTGAAFAVSATPGVGAAAETVRTDGKLSYSREMPVKADVDVFIAGGGPAGVAAAVSAARNGAKVFLAEGHSCFGGMSTAGRVPVFMSFGDKVNTYSQGVATEVRKLLKEESELVGGNDLEALKRVYDRMMTDSKAEFRFCTKVVDVVARDGRIRYAICSAPSGLFAVGAKVFVDATGNADLVAAAGAPFRKGDAAGRMMPGSLCSLWTGFDWDRWAKERPRKPKTFMGWADFMDEAFADGVFLEPDRHVTGFVRQERDLAAANMGHAFNLDATDEKSVTRALVRCRAQMKEWKRYFRDYVRRGTENIKLLATGELLGVRESRRMTADYTLSFADYRARAHFEDEIGRYSYPIDIHPSGGSKADMEKFTRAHRGERYKPGESYGIPFRSLVSKGFDNLLAAGRCIGTDEYVQSSVRVIPCCYITGQAAGTAAALAAKRDGAVRETDVRALRDVLRNQGAYLPA